MVADTHEIVSAFPQYFRAADEQRSRQRADVIHELDRVAWQQPEQRNERATLHTGKPRVRGQLPPPTRDVERERRALRQEANYQEMRRKVRLADDPSPYCVRISRGARTDIKDQVCDSHPHLEVGFSLFGPYPDHAGELYISHCGSPGRRCRRKPDRFIRDAEHEAIQWQAMRDRGLAEICFAHTHPGADCTPSERDLTVLAASREMWRLPAFCGLVITARTDDWSQIALDAWIARPVIWRGRRLDLAVVEKAGIILP